MNFFICDKHSWKEISKEVNNIGESKDAMKTAFQCSVATTASPSL
jgi:hypothetical protein